MPALWDKPLAYKPLASSSGSGSSLRDLRVSVFHLFAPQAHPMAFGLVLATSSPLAAG